MTDTAVPLPAPWRNIAAIRPDGSLIYYTEPSPSCLPFSSSLIRQTYKPPNPEALQHYPFKDLCDARILLIVNPAAGRGKNSPASLAKALQTVSKILQENGAVAIVRTTSRRGHVLDMFKEMGYDGLRELQGIVCCGGDGTLHEIVNAMIEVCSVDGVDWSKVPPIAIMPRGTGNAIAVSTGIKSAEHTALNIVHALRTDTAKPLALMQYRALSSPNRELLSIGGLQWGLTAEADFGTEHLRWMGNVRYDLSAITTIMMKRSWRARISVTVHREKNQALWKELEERATKRKDGETRNMTEGLECVSEDTYVMDNQFVLAVGWNSSMIAEGAMITPYAKLSETGVFDFIVLYGDLSRTEMINVFSHTKDASFVNNPKGYHMFKATRVVFEELEGRFLTIDGELVPVEPFVLEMAPEDGKLRFLDSFSEPCRNERTNGQA